MIYKDMEETFLFSCTCGDSLRCIKPLSKCPRCGKENGYELIE